MRRTLIALVAVMTIAGCSTTQGEADADAQERTNAVAADETGTDEGMELEPNEEAPVAPGVLKVGQAFTWDDGVTAIVTSVNIGTVISPDDYMPTPNGVVVGVQVQNGSAGVLDLALADAQLTYGAAGTQAESTLPESGDQGFTGSLPPGGTVSAQFAFFAFISPADRSVLNVQFAPTWDHETAFWATA